MAPWTISQPNPAGGGFQKPEHVGHLVTFVDVTSEEVDKFSGDGKQTAARCEYVVCVECRSVFADQLMFGEALVPRILDAGEIVAGRLVTGQARVGRSAPYLLDDPTDSDVQTVEAFLDKYAVKMPSGKIVVEAPVDETVF